jgi:adenine phosphoribosyltransferase
VSGVQTCALPILDDLIATGDTALAACNLVEKLGGKVEECAFVIELPDLEGRERLESNKYKIFSIVKFRGE